MEFRIADTFTDSLARLTADEQKAIKTTAFDLQIDPSSPGMSFHKLDKAKDKNFWSVRVNRDIRLIVHKTEASLLLCYVDHHDKAYHWAERRKLETHPKTGAAQLVEIRETIQQVVVPVYVHAEVPAKPKPPLFAKHTDDALLKYGVPPEWIKDVREADEDSLLALADHLPAEASEALLELATGGKPVVAKPFPSGADPFAHPDAQRRFRTLRNVEELERALDFPWDKWSVFLHPDQRDMVERDYAGPARVSGSAGTGKTIVALHRAVFLARKNPDARILLTTFSDILANALHQKLRRLISNEPHLAERLEVHSIADIGQRLYKALVGAPNIATHEALTTIIKESAAAVPDHKFTQAFLLSEWDQVVDAWRLDSWEAYREVKRLGRKTRLSEPSRAKLWSIFDLVRSQLAARKLLTEAGLFTELASILNQAKRPPFDFTVIDEAQDIAIPHLRFLAALAAKKPNGILFAGDSGQRIFQQPFSWKALGVDIRGRARTLTVNYRTSHQISERSKEGVMPHEFGVFVRSAAEIDRARAAVKDAGIAFNVLDERVETVGNKVCIATMHLAKGLEFRAVVVMACDDEIIPLQARVEAVTDEADLQDVYNTERHLLYVACTRARDHLLITSVDPASEFLDDLGVPASPSVRNVTSGEGRA